MNINIIVHNYKDIEAVNMVKGYDTTKSDPSKILLDYLFSFTDTHSQSLSIQTANTYIKQWLKSSLSTSSVYKKFQNFDSKPEIVLHRYCSKPFFSRVPYQGDFNFPAYQEQEKVHICLNRVRNKIQLKQNLDRELYSMYYNAQQNKQQHQVQDIVNKANSNNSKNNSNDNKQNLNEANNIKNQKQLIINLFQSCKQGYRNYGWDQQVTDRVSKKCAVYLFRRRSASDLPPDSLFRYASKIAEQYCV